jgi:long-chain acyl-CoA synthetase
LQGYGLTETSGAATVTRFEDNKVGSVGTPLNGVEVKIDEPNDAGIGEVLIRGPIVMRGYYHNPKANREAFTEDGWFRSGDLGRFDARGHLYIVGRKKDVIMLPNGKNVFPEDVEAHYERSPVVSEVCVVGVKDTAAGFSQAEKLCAVVVPNFDYLKAQKIANTREWIRYELENLGRELPEYQRVHDFILRADPLPRTTTRKVKRFELRDQLESYAAFDSFAPKERELTFNAEDSALMESAAGRALSAVIKQHAPDTKVIHPEMNLEIDLGLDSLARAECIAGLEQSLGIELKAEEAAAALKAGELIHLANTKINEEAVLTAPPSRKDEAEAKTDSSATVKARWSEILSGATTDLPELQRLQKRKPLTALLAYSVLRVVYLCARLLFRMEVKGSDKLSHLKPPYLICPNHQSYLDPFLVCSVYPRHVLKNIFHVGASMYFTNFLMAQLARLINVVPIDTDAHLVRAMRVGAAGIRAGKILNIYPEGQRSFDGHLQEFKKGAAILATELNVPLVPVALDGVHRIWPRKSWRFRLAKVKINFGEPLDVLQIANGTADDEAVYERVTAELKDRIQQMLCEMRRGEPGRG